MKLLQDRIREVLQENPQLDGYEGQAGLARAAGATKSVANQWVTGEIKSMRLDYALRLEEALGYNHVWLVLGTGEKRAPKRSASDRISADEIVEFINIIKELNHYDRTMVMDSAKLALERVLRGRNGATIHEE